MQMHNLSLNIIYMIPVTVKNLAPFAHMNSSRTIPLNGEKSSVTQTLMKLGDTKLYLCTVL